jgi:branched-chain amino acid transport system permease protein
MLQYVIAGLAVGGIYALLAGGLVVSYVSSGTMNFAFGAMAYFIARLFYFLHVQHGWGPLTAASVSVFVAAPALGIVLWAVLFRRLQHATQLTKVAATIGLSVALPAAAALLFGNISILRAPGLAPRPLRIVHVAGTPVTMDQIILYIAVLVVTVVGLSVLRYTAAGLTVRATVDSPALTAVSGTNPTVVSLGVWIVASMIAGVVGVLGAPLIGLSAGNFAAALAAAFAAVVAARLRSLPVALVVALAMGVTGALLQWALPSSSTLTANALNAVPFVFVLVFLLYFAVRRDTSADLQVGGGELDRAIQPALSSWSGSLADRFRPLPPRRLLRASSGSVLVIAAVLVLIFVLSAYWVSLIAFGIALAIVFLGISIVTGEGGMIWLCQITFAGLGAIFAGQLTSQHGWPVIAAVLCGGLAVMPIGLLIGALTIRLGDLYTALVTLTFGLVVERIIYHLPKYYMSGSGVPVGRPSFAIGDQAFAVFALVAFCIFAVIASQLRLATTGLALASTRTNPVGARTIGLSVTSVRLVVAALGAFVAAVGGGFLAMYATAAIPDSYLTLTGLVWLAVVVTVGVRSNTAALVGGLLMSVLPGLVLTHLPLSWAEVPVLAFGVGAVMVAANPDGSVSAQGAQLRAMGRSLTARFFSSPPPPPALVSAVTSEATAGGER